MIWYDPIAHIIIHTAAEATAVSRADSSQQEGAGSARFVSVPDFSRINRFGSVRFRNKYVSRFDTVRPAFFGCVVARSGSVRFVSAHGYVQFQNQTVRFGSAPKPPLTQFERKDDHLIRTPMQTPTLEARKIRWTSIKKTWFRPINVKWIQIFENCNNVLMYYNCCINVLLVIIKM